MQVQWALFTAPLGRQPIAVLISLQKGLWQKWFSSVKAFLLFLFIERSALYAAQCDTAHDEFGKQQVNDDDRNDGDGDKHINFSHVKF